MTQFAWKKMSVPIRYDKPTDKLGHLVSYYGRKAKNALIKPTASYFYFGAIDDGWVNEYRHARDLWKQNTVGFISAEEYRRFHVKMV